MTFATNLISGASHTNAKTQNAALRAPYLMLLLALAGIADASYVAHASLTGQPLREFFIEGANTVLNSPYARIAGGPLSYLGLVFYSYMFALCALLAFDPLSRGLRVGALLYTALGVASSIYFMYLQVNFIRAICVYCAFSAFTTLVLFIAALWHFASTRRVASL
jgi:uncharacterized membrane protein